MSPAAKSKSKKAGKEPAKSSSKPSGHVNTSNGIPASGYNPLLGTFQTLDSPPAASASPLNTNVRFRNIDDTDDHNGNSNGTGLEYDSVSNNGSWSGESEDHKEKASQPSRQESVPGADNDKREKIRQKNERKHQRQKEKRAQELREKCSGYLMSRKLEALAQQLVAMGFSHERATMALILNEGRVEESVAWLFEGGEDDKRFEDKLDSGGNLKIDISEELAKIADMEIRYKASRQEVERAIVNCEGDLEKAEESLMTQKQDPPTTPSKHEATSDPPTPANGGLPAAVSQNVTRIQVQPKPSPVILQQKNDEKVTKAPATTARPHLDPGTKGGTQPSKKIPLKMEWAKPQQVTVPTEKGWSSSGPNPSVSYSVTSTLQASPALSKMEAQYLAVGNELKGLQLGSVREPVTVMQRPQSINAKQFPSSSASSSPPIGWHPINGDTVAPNGLVRPAVASRSLSPNGVGPNPSHGEQLRYQPSKPFMPNRGVSPTLSAASSLGLFSGLGGNSSSGSSSPVDWNTGSNSMPFDYTNIDWSLDRGSLTSRPNGLWNGATSNFSLQRNPSWTYNSFSYGLGMKLGMRPGLQDGVPSADSAALGSWEWTSPFEEKDLFSLPRQYVSSPSL